MKLTLTILTLIVGTLWMISIQWIHLSLSPIRCEQTLLSTFKTTFLNKMKTYYDIAIHTATNDVVSIKGVSYSQMMKIANDNPTLLKVEIVREYSKKISKY
jgi:hypothetical protein